MQRRIFGLENEYGLISSSAGGRVNLSVESALGYLFEKVVSRQRGTNDFLRSYMAKKGIGFDDQRISMLDLQYHDIRQDRGLYNTLCRQGHIERVTSDQVIEEAMTAPPQTTRAKIRSDFICKDPFKPTDPRVEEMINS